ncbi:MAG: M48 family metallopeptidase, partial [Paracoccaceae bacterium]
MSQLVLAGDPPVEISLRRTRQARRISLRVSQFDGRVTLSLPHWMPPLAARKFAAEKERWIRRQLAARAIDVWPAIGGHVMFEGKDVPVVTTPSRSTRFVDGKIMVPGDGERAPARLAAFFKVMARQRLSAACDGYADRLALKFHRITLRDTRSRWGSCSAGGGLMFSWRLIMAPERVLQYVAAHEVAHLAEMNHSPAFWATVEGLYPAFDEPRQWLRENGHRLHSY